MYDYLRAAASHGFRKHKDLAFIASKFRLLQEYHLLLNGLTASTRKWLHRAVEGKVLHDFVNRSFCYPRVAGNLGHPYSIIVQINNLFPDKHGQCMVYRASKMHQGNF